MQTIYRIIAVCFLLVSCQEEKVSTTHIDISGEWQFALDTASIGEKQEWYKSKLEDQITLPATTDEAKKGFKNKDTTTNHLNRVYYYVGKAWYQKKILIPADFENKHIYLYLERTKPSKVWLDNQLIGTSKLLQSAQNFDISEYAKPGEHTLTIMVDNDTKKTPYGNVHIYAEDTQTNWNGILGKMAIIATPKTYLKNIKITPNVSDKKIEVAVKVNNGLNLPEADFNIEVEDATGNKVFSEIIQQKSIKDTLSFEVKLPDNIRLWDEYQQPLYTLNLALKNDSIQHSKQVSFGMREFKTNGKHFTINGRTTFLRGKHEAAVFPLTGYPPMDSKEWERVFTIAKKYGINHYRFHTYCPPEAAFIAADKTGMYLQPELPFWGGLNADSTANALLTEGKALLDAYGNHPSFVMFSHGNEIWSGHERVEKNIAQLKNYDNRFLYAHGCNNNIGYLPPSASDDFFVASRTPYKSDTIMTHTRLTHAFADTKNGGILNTTQPATNFNFEKAVTPINVPVISHEIGQYQIYPDYQEIKKYTGVLKAWNFIEFQKDLIAKGMGDMDSIFQQATGKWSAICYKAEMEAALRTPGMAGFQLLDLQDYPGQGTALVGILDAFMDSKGVVTPEVWKQSCNDIVLLVETPKFVWQTNELFKSKLVVANYSNKKITDKIQWELRSSNNQIIDQGTFDKLTITEDSVTDIGSITHQFSIEKPERLTLNVRIPGTGYENNYPIWCYPQPEKPLPSTKNTIITTELTKNTIEKLKNGENILYFPQTEAIASKSVPGLFPPDFWNYDMFRKISENNNKPVSPGTLGILTNPEHPVFNSFPTEFHTNWQWFSIIKKSNAFILDNLNADFKPIVQVIDNLQRNHKLGLLFEFKVGKGRILICSAQLNQLQTDPAGKQLYRSIINYMNSESFSPSTTLSGKKLYSLFHY